ncbi:PdaC/SigV domain-containing protein [Clostridium ganghwense]|uniref:DUF4163 domain-containing protein n=1 Tax=Clostridium ganghwense TaxID=312089 RepID=A0ABT4CLS2_9CLOT|nr:DUF4163 domain-containing protein [Clostridium ganghwense]MCY6369983.1 DUF4163 domain-containing protein [Clostridium ganghwense]
MKKVMCLGLIGLLGLGNTSYAFAQENPKAIEIKVNKMGENSKAAVNIKAKEIKYKNEAIDVNIKIPVLDGMKDKSIQKKINAMLEEGIIEFKEELEELAKEELEYSKEDKDWQMRPYVANVYYKVHNNQNNLLSISVIYYQYTGGAHGNTVQKTFNIDIDTGNEATLKDFFYEGENYKEIISKEIKKQIEVNMKSNKNMYFKGSLDVVNTISNNQSFYIEDGNIVVYYGLYEIAPYAAGIQPFKIPFSSFKKGMKKEINVKYAPIKVKAKKIRSKDKAFLSDLRIPVIEGIRDTKLQKKLNDTFEKDITNFKNEIQKEAKEWEKEAKKQGWKIHPYDAATNYTVNYNENDLLSISVDYYQYTGGAHGNFEKRTTNIDLKTGKEIALKDLFKHGVNYKETINKEIKKQIEAQIQEMKKDMETEGIKYEDKDAPYKDFKGISDNQTFYIENGKIVVYFGLYEIGSYVEGIPEFRIPVSQIKDSVKTEFLGL